jgi:hypothetical protein
MIGPISGVICDAHHPTKSAATKGKVAQNSVTALSLRRSRSFCHGEFAGAQREEPQIVERSWS